MFYSERNKEEMHLKKKMNTKNESMLTGYLHNNHNKITTFVQRPFGGIKKFQWQNEKKKNNLNEGNANPKLKNKTFRKKRTQKLSDHVANL